MQIKAAHLGDKTAKQRASAQAEFDKLTKKPGDERRGKPVPNAKKPSDQRPHENSVPNASTYESLQTKPVAQPSKQPGLTAMEGRFFHFGAGKRQMYRQNGERVYLDVRDHSPVPLVIGRPVDLASCVHQYEPPAKPQTKQRHKARKLTTH